MNNEDLMFSVGIDRTKLKRDINEIAKDVLGLERKTQGVDLIGINKENLQIQKEIIKGLTADLRELGKVIDKTAPGQKKYDLMAEFQILENELNAEKKALSDLEIELRKSGEAHQTLAQKLNDTRQQMQALKLAGKENTEEYKNLRENAANYQRSIDEVNKSVLSMSKGGFQPLVTVLNEVSGMFAVGAGAIGLFRTENETLKKITEKVSSLTAVAVGIQNLHTSAMRSSVSVTSLLSGASTRLATALGLSTVAARALLITLTGGLILAIPALIALYDRYIAQNQRLLQVQNQLDEVSKIGVKNAAAEVTKLDMLYRKTKDTTKSTDERKKAVLELQKQYPAYFKNLSSEIIMNGKAEKSYHSLRSAIIASAKAKAAQGKIDELSTGFLEEEMKIRDKMTKAKVDEMTAKGKTVLMGSGQGTQSVFISADEEKKAARARFNMHTEELKQFYIRRNKIIGQYSKFIDKESATAAPLTEEVKIPATVIPKLSTGTTPTPTDKNPILEEILPAGSVAEIQKRLSAIDEALKKANQQEVIDELKNKRITTETELSEALARISTDTTDKEKERLEKALNDFLNSHQSYEEKRIGIINKYAELRTIATDEQNQKINQAEKEELSALAMEEFKKSEDWLKAFGDVSRMGAKQLKDILAKLKQTLSENTDKFTASDLKALSDQIQKMENQLKSSNPFMTLKKAIEEYIKKVKEGQDATSEFKTVMAGIAEVSGIVNQGLSSAVSIADDLGIKLSDGTKDAIENVQTVVGGVGDIASGLASGNIAGVMKGIAGVVKGLSNIFSGDQKKERNIKRWAAEVVNLKNVYEQLQHQVKKALGEDVYADQQKIIANLRQQQAMLQKMMTEESRKKKADKNKVNDYKKEIDGISQVIDDMYSDIARSITQTDARVLADQLADALIEAYGKGEDAASAYGKVAEDVMKQAVKNALKMQLLEKPMQNIVSQMLKSMGFDEKGNGTFDGLTADERENLKAMFKTSSENYMNALNAYSEMFGQVAGTAQGMKGDIKGVTERTAGALEAQINAMRVIQAENFNVSRSSLMELSKIEANTRTLHEMNRNIRELNDKTKNQLAGLRATGLI